ncbi:terpenoid cyclase domain-containing protein [Desulfonema limicola]|uniref:Terpenoid cyclase domain-containing protein n=2 Tax=Desulfonema limicola TaxID=45656 RepID=A0A975GID3_9BACT|nr:terpenoid cyclase domain-containing protein [Desulfonema limicola]
MPLVYHSGIQGYNYHGPATGYRNVSKPDDGLNIVEEQFKKYYSENHDDLYSGLRSPGTAANYLTWIWNGNSLGDNFSFDQQVINEIKIRPLILNIRYNNNKDWGHYIVLRGYDDNDTPDDNTDDKFYVNDPYTNWPDNPPTGENREFDYTTLSSWYKGRAITFVPVLNKEQREYAVVVDSGNPKYENTIELDNINAQNADNNYIWKEWYGAEGDWYYPSEGGHWAQWTPALSKSSYYKVNVIYRSDEGQDTVNYSIYNSGGQLIDTIPVNQKAPAALNTNLLGISFLDNGAYVRVNDVPASCNIDAVRFERAIIPFLSLDENPDISNYNVYGIADESIYGALDIDGNYFHAEIAAIDSFNRDDAGNDDKASNPEYLAQEGDENAALHEINIINGSSDAYQAGDYLFLASVSDNEGTRNFFPIKFTVVSNALSRIVDNDQINNDAYQYENNIDNIETNIVPGYYLTAKLVKGQSGAWAKWKPSIEGQYKVYIHSPKDAEAADIVYQIKTDGTDENRILSEPVSQVENQDGWVQIVSSDGNELFEFTSEGYVQLDLGSDENKPFSNHNINPDTCVAFDAVKFVAEASSESNNITLAIKGGQQYLKVQQVEAVYDEEGNLTDGGYWTDSRQREPLASTAFAVSALLETGVPRTDQTVIDGVNYIKQYVNEDGGIYMPSNRSNYINAACLVALSLYGIPGADAEYDTMVQNSMDYSLSRQNLPLPEGSLQTPEEYYGAYYGGWTYRKTSSGEQSQGDLSNTQFAVMGLWYAHRYLGKSTIGEPWSEALFTYLKRCHGWYDEENGQTWNDQAWAKNKNVVGTDGGFSYKPDYAEFYPGGSMTAAGIWSLFMIGHDQHEMINIAIEWFDHNYTWDINPGAYYSGDMSAYYYYVYSMAKALTSVLGNQLVGEHDWIQDLKDTMLEKMIEVDGNEIPAQNYWAGTGSLDGGNIIATSWVLMSLAFAAPDVESPEKILADDPNLETPIPGSVTISADGDVTISDTLRVSFQEAEIDPDVVLPVGGFEFTFNKVGQGEATVLTIKLPKGALEPGGENSFINEDGSQKEGLAWFKIQEGKWVGLPDVLIEIDMEAYSLQVTLKDGGPEDADGLVNGKIVDPGAPGYGFKIDTDESTLHDMDKNGKVDVIDIMLVASHWNTATGDANYDAKYDLNSDGKIDVTDIMLVAAQWGKTVE